MKVLVTGANGLVGSAVVKRFLAEGHDVMALCRANANLSLLATVRDKIEVVEGDVLDILSLQTAIQSADYVIHTAAVVSFSPREKEKLYKVNVEGTANVVNVCLDAQNLKKLCFVSSIAALGRPETNANPTALYEIDERQMWIDSPLNSHYAKSKYQAECEVWRGEAEGLPVVIVNPSIVIGEADWRQSSTQLFNYVHKGTPFYTDGYLNYVDVKDVAEAIYRLTVSEITSERFILSANSISYQEYFAKIAYYFHKKAPAIRLPKALINVLWRIEAIRAKLTGATPLITKETAKTAQTRFHYKNDKIKKSIGFEFAPLDQSISRVCDFLKS